MHSPAMAKQKSRKPRSSTKGKAKAEDQHSSTDGPKEATNSPISRINHFEPKKPLTSYLFFANDKSNALKKEYPQKSFGKLILLS